LDVAFFRHDGHDLGRSFVALVRELSVLGARQQELVQKDADDGGDEKNGQVGLLPKRRDVVQLGVWVAFKAIPGKEVVEAHLEPGFRPDLPAALLRASGRELDGELDGELDSDGEGRGGCHFSVEEEAEEVFVFQRVRGHLMEKV
jgi:hypothetical protein